MGRHLTVGNSLNLSLSLSLVIREISTTCVCVVVKKPVVNRKSVTFSSLFCSSDYLLNHSIHSNLFTHSACIQLFSLSSSLTENMTSSLPYWPSSNCDSIDPHYQKCTLKHCPTPYLYLPFMPYEMAMKQTTTME